jgi:hypothetical protein
VAEQMTGASSPRRGITELTGWEQLSYASGFLLMWGATLALTAWLGLPGVWPGVVGYGAAMATTPLVARYARTHEPWAGPKRIRLSTPGRRMGAGGHRVATWYRRPGRPALVLTFVALAFVVAPLIGQAGNNQLQHTLHTRGVSTTAEVVGISRTSRVGVDGVTVRFAANGITTRQDLGNIDGLPSGIDDGQSVVVVFDPRDSSQVLLASQLHNGNETWGTWTAAASAVIAIGSFFWYLKRRRTN